jgi:UDP-N-acetylglucosamine 2-epimerase (non-hydrolysing)
MKAFVALGTRPEAIKLAPVIAALRERTETVVCTTGQHPELAAEALGTFGIVPDLALPSVPRDRSLNRLTAMVLEGLDAALTNVRPNWVVVQGDTNSSFAGGLAAFQRHIPVAHVEAGLRTLDREAPFPEESNRQMLARIARLHFAPTSRAVQNLRAEGIDAATIIMCGNTSVDAAEAAQHGWDAAKRQALAANLGVRPGPLVIVSCHRRENRGQVLTAICSAVRRLAQRYAGHNFLFPVHPDPSVRAIVEVELSGVDNVFLRGPLGYEETLYALAQCDLVVTDSGGLQEEVAAFHKPVIVMRDRTERMEGVDAGFATLSGRDPAAIEAAAAAWLDDAPRRASLAGVPNPYGDGRASLRIADALVTADAHA